MKSILRTLIFSFALAASAKFTFEQYQWIQQESLTRDLCVVAGNAMETGNLREVYETLSSALLKAKHPDSCVSVLDNGRNFAPNCVDSTSRYQTTVCRADANKGVRAEIHFLQDAFFTLQFFELWLICFLSLVGLGFISSRAIFHIANRIVVETKDRLFQESQPPENFWAKWIDWLLGWMGVLDAIKVQGEKFEGQLKKYSGLIKEEAALRAKNEIEISKSKEFIEKIRLIRHDLRSPLSALLALKSELRGDQLVEDTIGTIIDRIRKMIGQLNTFEADKTEEHSLVVAEVDVEQIIAFHSSRFRTAKNTRISVSYNHNKLSPLMAPADLLWRVIENILENSFDAVTSDGEINVTILNDGSNCRIQIDDDGCGISSEAVPHLFTKNATFRKVGGNGIGLHNCKRIIESAGGSLKYEPLAKGSRFVVTLPLAQVGVSFIGPIGIRRIALIDDDSNLKTKLKMIGFEVVTWASSFEEGRSLLKNISDPTVTILIDEFLDDNQLGTNLIAQSKITNRHYLCTDDYSSPDVIERARLVGVKVLPKPLCRLANPRGLDQANLGLRAVQ